MILLHLEKKLKCLSILHHRGPLCIPPLIFYYVYAEQDTEDFFPVSSKNRRISVRKFQCRKKKDACSFWVAEALARSRSFLRSKISTEGSLLMTVNEAAHWHRTQNSICTAVIIWPHLFPFPLSRPPSPSRGTLPLPAASERASR